MFSDMKCHFVRMMPPDSVTYVIIGV